MKILIKIILSIIIGVIAFGGENFFKVLLKFAEVILFVKPNMYDAK